MTMTFCLFVLWLRCRSGKQNGWPWSVNAVAGGVKLIEANPRLTRLRLPRYDAFSNGLLTMTGLLLLAGLWMMSASENAAALATGAGLLTGVLVLGALVYAWFAVPACSGRQDLVVDAAGRTLQLPCTYGRQTEPLMGFDEISSVALDKIKHTGKRGPYYTYLVTLQRKNGELKN